MKPKTEPLNKLPGAWMSQVGLEKHITESDLEFVERIEGREKERIMTSFEEFIRGHVRDYYKELFRGEVLPKKSFEALKASLSKD